MGQLMPLVAVLARVQEGMRELGSLGVVASLGWGWGEEQLQLTKGKKGEREPASRLPSVL